MFLGSCIAHHIKKCQLYVMVSYVLIFANQFKEYANDHCALCFFLTVHGCLT